MTLLLGITPQVWKAYIKQRLNDNLSPLTEKATKGRGESVRSSGVAARNNSHGQKLQ